MFNNSYREALKNANNENKELRKALKEITKKLDALNDISEKKDIQLENLLEQNEDYEEKLRDMRRGGGGVVGKATQVLKKYNNNDNDLLTE